MSYMPPMSSISKPPAKFKMPKTDSVFMKYLYRASNYVTNQIQSLNQSKIFAGIMIITINIASKFVNFKLSKTTESYLRYTFSRDILIFAIMWMGTRDILIALGMTLLFILFMDYLFNENSTMCILPEGFTEFHISKLDNQDNAISTEDIRTMETILEKVKNVQRELDTAKVAAANE